MFIRRLIEKAAQKAVKEEYQSVRASLVALQMDVKTLRETVFANKKTLYSEITALKASESELLKIQDLVESRLDLGERSISELQRDNSTNIHGVQELSELLGGMYTRKE